MSKRNRIQAIDKMVRILDYLRDNDGAGITEIANSLSLAKSSVHRHLVTLEDHGFITQNGTEYQVGVEFLSFGIYARDQFDLFPIAESKVDELAEETGELAWCIVEENGYARFMYKALGRHPVKPGTKVGKKRYLHETAAGKAILAHLPTERIDEIISMYGDDLPANTENTITETDQLYSELTTIQEQGYAVNEGESIKGLNAIAAPITNTETGEVLGALSVAGPKNRLSEDLLRGEFRDLILGTTNEIEINISRNSR